MGCLINIGKQSPWRDRARIRRGMVPVFVPLICSQNSMTWPVEGSYRFMALAPNAPSTAEATAIIAFRMISHTDFFIDMVVHLLSDAVK